MRRHRETVNLYLIMSAGDEIFSGKPLSLV